MTKPTGKKIKGNKDDAKHFIEFFDNEFFGIIDDDNKKTTNQTISLTVPIDEGTTQKSKSNLAEHKVPQIEDFTDIEAVIKSILQLRNSVLVHKTNGTYIDSVKKEIQHIQLICTTGSSDTIFRNLTAEARTIAFDKFTMPLMVLPGDALEKEILVRDHSSFCKRIDAAKMPNAYLDRFYPDDHENSPD